MTVMKAEATWEGTIKKGRGRIKPESETFEGIYSFGTRYGDEAGTNPEELIGAACAGCFSMALALFLEEAGHTPKDINTTSTVHVEQGGDGFMITGIELETEAFVPGLDGETFQQKAKEAKQNCPVSKALDAPIMLKAKLV